MTSALDPLLLKRLCEGDPVASAEFCEYYLPPLAADRRWVAGRTRDDHLIQEAANDAVLDFVEHPSRYDPARLDVLPYLRMVAGRDLLNALAREQRHASRRAPLEAVELDPPAGNDQVNEIELPDGVSRELLLRRLRERLPDARDWEAMCLMIDGVRETTRYALVYGLTDLPPEKQRSEVKRHKDRLGKQARRLGIQIRHERS